MKLENKVALVTGAGSGIGKAIALLFAREGADIGVNDIDGPSAEKTAAAVRKLGRKAAVLVADVSRSDGVSGMVARLVDELGRVDILVNNAGVPAHGPMIEDQTEERWDRVVAVILRGTYLCSRAVGKLMAQQKSGKIVNIASIGGLIGSAGLTSYGAAKAGVISLTRSLAIEWGEYHINVNCIAPGVIDTPLTRRTTSTPPEQRGRAIPLGRWGEAEDVAKAALFLASDYASYISGVTLPVDGGWLARSSFIA